MIETKICPCCGSNLFRECVETDFNENNPTELDIYIDYHCTCGGYYLATTETYKLTFIKEVIDEETIDE